MSYSAITANNIKGISGTPLNGWVTFSGPVNGSGAPVSAVANGGPVMYETKKFLVVNGLITGDDSSPQVPAQLVDSTTANPANIGYTVKFYDNVRGLIPRTGYVCVQPAGPTWTLDTYVPSQPAISVITSGPQGPAGDVSNVQLASIRPRTSLTANVFNPAAKRPGYYLTPGGGEGGGGSYDSLTVTDWMPCNAGGQMVMSIEPFGDSGVAIQFASGSFEAVAGEIASRPAAGLPFTCPDGAAFFRTHFDSNANFAGLVITSGSVLPPIYSGFVPVLSGDPIPQIDAIRPPLIQAMTGQNILDPSTTVHGYLHNGSAGATNAETGTSYTPVYPVVPGTVLVCNKDLPVLGGNNTRTFYDRNGGYVSGTTGGLTAGTPLVAPAGAYGVQFTVSTGDLSSIMIVYGATVPAAYQAFGTGAATAAATSAAKAYTDNALASFIAPAPPNTGNLLDLTACTDHAYCNFAGGVTTGFGGTVTATGMIPVKAGQQITCNVGLSVLGGNNCYMFLAANGAVTASSNASPGAGTPLTAPANTVGVRYTIDDALLGSAMVFYGASVPQEYQGYNANHNTPLIASDVDGSQLPWKNKTVLLVGTSIPAQNPTPGGSVLPGGAGYVSQLFAALQCVGLNQARGGSHIVWDGSNAANVGLSNTNAEYASLRSDITGAGYSYESILIGQNADLVIFDHSINDQGFPQGNVLYQAGDLNEDGSVATVGNLNVNRHTVAGAFNYVIGKMLQYKPFTRFCFLTACSMFTPTGTNPPASGGPQQLATRATVKALGTYWNSPVLDWSYDLEMGLKGSSVYDATNNPLGRTADGTHPIQRVHDLAARRLIRFVASI